MIIPIVSIPPSIANGLKHYKDLFPRRETFQHIQEYCTGMVVLDKPSIKRISQCFVDGPCQSSLNKSITASPWSEESVNQKRLESIQQYHNNGFTVGIIDTTLFHHPRGQSIYGVYKYWDYINNNYTYAIQLVTSAISTNDRLDGFDYKIYHRSFVKQEKLYLEDTALTAEKQDISTCQNRLIELLNFQLHKQQAKTKDQLAVELIDEMESSNLAPDAYAVDSSLFTPVVIERIEQAEKPWVADSEKNRILYHKGQSYNCETFNQTIPKESFREINVSVRYQERTGWMFTCTVRIRRYGKVRFAIIYDNPDKQNQYMCLPICWYGTTIKILSVLVSPSYGRTERSHRWDIEPFHEQIKQFLGAEVVNCRPNKESESI